MGGSIRVVVRTAEKTRVVVGWTNELPLVFARSPFLDGDPSVWDDYLNFYEKYEEEEVGGPRTEDPHLVAPYGYGIYVIDYTTRNIFSMQGFCKPETMCADILDEGEPFVSEAAEQFRRGILRAPIFNQQTQEYDLVPVSSLEDAIRLFNEQRVFHFERDIAPWTHMRWNSDEAELLRDALLLEDFELSPAELQVWNAWISREEDSEEEDSEDEEDEDWDPNEVEPIRLRDPDLSEYQDEEPPPGWTLANDGPPTTGSMGVYPPGTPEDKIGSERVPRISNACTVSAIQLAWEWVRGEVPLETMTVARYNDDNHLCNLVRYHLGMDIDPDVHETLRKWYVFRALPPEEQARHLAEYEVERKRRLAVLLKELREDLVRNA